MESEGVEKRARCIMELPPSHLIIYQPKQGLDRPALTRGSIKKEGFKPTFKVIFQCLLRLKEGSTGEELNS